MAKSKFVNRMTALAAERLRCNGYTKRAREIENEAEELFALATNSQLVAYARDIGPSLPALRPVDIKEMLITAREKAQERVARRKEKS